MIPPRPRFFGVRRVLDFAAAVLCIWAGLAHTPPGALLRFTIARLTNTHTSARPLFAYYTGGIYESAPAITKPLPPPVHALSAQDALGAGAAIALDNLEAAQRTVPLAMLAREGVNEREALDPHAGPHHLSIAITRLRDRYGSEDLAMLALFCGDESARYAKEQAPANAELPQLVRVLPRGLCDRGPLA
ncbi:MAG: hypothetical protein JST92_09055, partial [Deltaproteobacteria bacterium]|nr:hypothetical protein [Deltaproteobacteria bacterium]